MNLHHCEPGFDLDKGEHVFLSGGYGPAIESCEENEQGELWVGNSEYSTQVNFCPFCGYKARVRVEWDNNAGASALKLYLEQNTFVSRG